MKGRVQIGLLILILTVGSFVSIIATNDESIIVLGTPVSIDAENILFNATEDLLFEEVIEPIEITGDDLTWNVIGIPDWLSFQNGTMYGVPGNDDVGWNNFSIEITTSNDDATLNVSISVENVLPEIVEGSAAPMAWEDQEYTSRFDLREDGSKWSVSLNMKGPWESTWAQLEIDGTVYGTPKNIHVGNWTLNITLNDGNGGVDWFEWNVTVVNENPRIWVKEFGVVQEWEEKVIDFECISENDGATYYELVKTNLDSGVFDMVNGQFKFIPGKDDKNWCYITIRAIDFFGGIYDFGIEFTVNNSIPVLYTELPTVIKAGELVEIDLSSSEEISDLQQGNRYNYIDKWPVFTDYFNNRQSFNRFGSINFFAWNSDAGDHSFKIGLTDDMGPQAMVYYWNFTIIENSTFKDPVIEVDIINISNLKMEIEVNIDMNDLELYQEGPYSDHGIYFTQPGDWRIFNFIEYDPHENGPIEIDLENLSGTLNLTVSVAVEQFNGSYRHLRKTVQIKIPTEDPVHSNENGGKQEFPWWIFFIVIILLIIILAIVLIFIENVSYAVQMAVFRGGNIDEKPIITLVHDRPGIHYKEILDHSNFSRKDLVSTLIELEKNGTVRPIPDGILVRFYPTVGSFVDGPLVLNRFQERVVKVLLDRKKTTQQELSNESGLSKRKLERETSLLQLKGALSMRNGKEGPEYYLSSKQKKMIILWMDSKPR